VNDGTSKVKVDVDVAVEVITFVVRLHLGTFLPAKNDETTSQFIEYYNKADGDGDQ